MYRLFETIRIADSHPMFIDRHEERMNRSIRALWPGSPQILLSRLLEVPGDYSRGVFRCNVFYNRENQEVVYKPYIKQDIRSFQLVYSDTIDYSFKFTDRQELLSLYDQRGSYDEVIIVRRGKITDTSVSNLIFRDGNRWYTPAEPLLAGTCRARLLSEGKIFERDIRPQDLRRYQALRMINAMRDMSEGEEIPVAGVRGLI